MMKRSTKKTKTAASSNHRRDIRQGTVLGITGKDTKTNDTRLDVDDPLASPSVPVPDGDPRVNQEEEVLPSLVVALPPGSTGPLLGSDLLPDNATIVRTMTTIPDKLLD